MPKVILPLFLLAAIGLSVYLVQQRTNITPFAATEAPTLPNGCKRIDLYNKGGASDRSVFFKDANDQGTGEKRSNGPEYEMFGRGNANGLPIGDVLRKYEFKDTMYRSQGWEFGIRKRKGQADVDKEGPVDKYKQVHNWNKYYECETTGLKADGVCGPGGLFEPGTMSHFDRPEFEGFWLKPPGKAKIELAGGRFYEEFTTLPAITYEHKDFDGKYPVYFRLKRGVEGEVDEEGVAQVIGSGVDKFYQRNPDQIFMYVPTDLNNGNVSCLPAGAGGGGGGSSPSPSSSASPIASPGGGGGAPVSLTKAEITGFKKNYDALYAVLGTTKDTGNLKIVSTLANTELNSIISELPTCPDDANVGKCIDDKFRTRFDLAKTAARLSAFYAVFNDVPGACVKSDLGLNPLITSNNQNGINGRVNLCNDRLVASKVWMIFANGQFTPILSTNTTFPVNPTCATLPADVSTHFRNAETLFKNQAGFLLNTLCDGKTSVAPGSEV